MTRIWAPKGTRPRKVRQKQFISTYIYGVACATTGDSFGLILPDVNTQSMQLFLDSFSKNIKKGRHAAIIIDNAGWHTAKDLNIPNMLDFTVLFTFYFLKYTSSFSNGVILSIPLCGLTVL